MLDGTGCRWHWLLSSLGHVHSRKEANFSLAFLLNFAYVVSDFVLASSEMPI